MLFQRETAGGRPFDRYDLYREVRRVRERLARDPGGGRRRRPSAWELVSAAVALASAGDAQTPALAELLAAYRRLTPVEQGSLQAEARLADQVYRLGASVCVDGCRACLHRSSPLMPDELTPAAVSREVLEHYREFVLEPGTVEVGASGPPEEAEVRERLRREGFCRLLVEPAANDGFAGELRRAGFGGGEYDPLLRRVVWVRES